jgi:hypothetical protein
VKKKNSYLKVITIFIQTLPAKLAGALFLILAFAGSCTDPSEIGLVLDPDSNQIGVFYTEIPLSASMVLYDSFNTTNQGRLVVGGDISPFFGITESIGISRLSFNPGGTKPNQEAIFDSAKFSMNVVDLAGTGFDQEKSFKVHRLLEQIQDTSYYNTSFLPFEEATIASGSFILRPDTVNTLTMDLNPDLAMDLFDRLTSNDGAFANIFSFREYFPGIAITGNPEEDVTVAAATGGGTGITLYYHYDEDTVSRTYPINTIQSRHFNHVRSDRSGTPTETITERGRAFDIPGDRVGSKANLGLMIKLDMEPLHDFLDTLSNITFNQITMEAGPVQTFPEHKRPIQNMVMYFLDENNRIYTRSDGAAVAVQGERQSQTGIDQQGNTVPSAGNQTSLVLNGESRIFQNQITS